MIILHKNNLAGPLNLVKLAWTCRSQYLFENNCLVFYVQLGQISVNRFFKWLFYLFWVKILYSVPKHYLYDCYISTLFILQVFNFCSIEWFRFQKPLAIGPFLIQRYQDFWDKILGGSLDFNLRGLGGGRGLPKNHWNYIWGLELAKNIWLYWVQNGQSVITPQNYTLAPPIGEVRHSCPWIKWSVSWSRS